MTMNSPSTLLSALGRRRFPASAWPWRGIAYAVTTAIASGLLWMCLSCPLAPLAISVNQISKGRAHLLVAVVLGLVGVVLLALAGPPLAVALGELERWRLRLADDRPARDGRSGNLYLDPATWRAFAYLLVLAVIAPVWLGSVALLGLLSVALIVTPYAVHASGPVVIGTTTVHSTWVAVLLAILGVALLPVLIYLTAAFAGAHAAIARALLSVEPDPAAAQLGEVARSRARLVDAFDAERHRIERDLHDGAQQRLVNLTMQLGLAKLDLAKLDVPDDSPAAMAVIAAHEQAKALMVDLRDLIHGINPRTLTELGLPAAFEELAATSSVPVTVQSQPGRFPAPVETVAYFAASEALANIAKHSGATQAAITATRVGNLLIIEVQDNGRGGANPALGSGLTGLADRVSAAGGRLLLSSPGGGGTIVRIELPCGS